MTWSLVESVRFSLKKWVNHWGFQWFLVRQFLPIDHAIDFQWEAQIQRYFIAEGSIHMSILPNELQKLVN